MQEKNSKKTLFSERLTALMSEKGLNQSSLSNLSGVNQSGISKYIRGDSAPRASELARMAMVLGVTMDYLWGMDSNVVRNDWQERAERAERDLAKLREALRILMNNVSSDGQN